MVPAHRWCLSYGDLEVLEREVREQWTAGLIPDRGESMNSFHIDPVVGPDIYQVTEHFIMPKVGYSKGTNYALMLHPEGLSCDVFISHAWSEGLFELCQKCRCAWPAGAEHLWLWFAAMLHNSENLHGRDESRSWSVNMIRCLAEAGLQSKAMIVVPNNRFNLFDRLWCVFEIKMAVEVGLHLALPSESSNAASRRSDFTCLPVARVLLPLGIVCLAAMFSSCSIVIAARSVLDVAKNSIGFSQFLLCLVVFGYPAVPAVLTLLASCGFDFSAHLEHYSQIMDFGFLAGIPLGIALSGGAEQLPCFTFVALFLSMVVFACRILVIVGSSPALRSYVFELNFLSLENAQCKCAEDEEWLRNELLGMEMQVRRAIAKVISSNTENRNLRAKVSHMWCNFSVSLAVSLFIICVFASMIARLPGSKWLVNGYSSEGRRPYAYYPELLDNSNVHVVAGVLFVWGLAFICLTYIWEWRLIDFITNFSLSYPCTFRLAEASFYFLFLKTALTFTVDRMRSDVQSNCWESHCWEPVDAYEQCRKMCYMNYMTLCKEFSLDETQCLNIRALYTQCELQVCPIYGEGSPSEFARCWRTCEQKHLSNWFARSCVQEKCLNHLVACRSECVAALPLFLSSWAPCVAATLVAFLIVIARWFWQSRSMLVAWWIDRIERRQQSQEGEIELAEIPPVAA